MLSGIGDADHLNELGIPVVANVPGVGQNLQDHLEIYVVQKCKKPITLLQDQKFPQMIKVGLQWFMNQTGKCTHFRYIDIHDLTSGFEQDPVVRRI